MRSRVMQKLPGRNRTVRRILPYYHLVNAVVAQAACPRQSVCFLPTRNQSIIVTFMLREGRLS